MSEKDKEKLLDERHEALMDGIKGINERLDSLNGRTRTLEVKTAVLQWAYGLTGVVGLAVFYYAFNLIVGK